VSGTLRKLGYAEVFALRGGIAAWQQAGLPLEK
jgi:rhodanese-related sulfurtransferase